MSFLSVSPMMRTPVDAAIGLRIFNECIGSHLFQCGLETCGQLAAAKQFADIGTCNFVVNLDGPASGLVRRDRCSGLASFDIGLCFESGSGLRVLSSPTPRMSNCSMRCFRSWLSVGSKSSS